MKKAIIYAVPVLLLLLTQGLPLQAQRMLSGHQFGIEARTGATFSGSPWRNPYLALQVSQFRSNGSYRFAELSKRTESFAYRDIHIPLTTYLAEAGYMIYLLGDAARTVVINVGASAFSGYGRNNKGERVLYDKSVILSNAGFIYGASGILSLDTYLSDRLVISAQGKARQYFGNAAGRQRYSAGIGLRYNFK